MTAPTENVKATGGLARYCTPDNPFNPDNRGKPRRASPLAFVFWDMSDLDDIDPEAEDSGIDPDKPIAPQIFDAETLARLEADLHQERIHAACLNREVTLTWGDGRTNNYGWKPKTESMREAIGKIMKHTPATKKDGGAYLMGGLAPGQDSRKAAHMRTFELVAYDIDNGQPSAEIIARARATGTHVDIHPSWSSGKPTTGIPIDALAKHHKLPPDTVPTIEHVVAYLRDIKKWRADLLATVTAVEQVDFDMVVTHAPYERFRCVIPFTHALRIAKLGVGLKPCAANWVRVYLGFAEFMGIEHCDPACKDIVRLFYPNRRPYDSTDGWVRVWGSAINPDELVKHFVTDAKARAEEKAAAEKPTNAFTEAAKTHTGADARKGDGDTEFLQRANALVKNFGRFMAIGAASFAAQCWVDHLPKEDWCPWSDDHTEKNQGCEAYDGDGGNGGFGFYCYHGCNSDTNRGARDGAPMGEHGRILQDRAKYALQHCINMGIDNADDLIELCDDAAKAEWAEMLAKQEQKQEQEQEDTQPTHPYVEGQSEYVIAANVSEKKTDWLWQDVLPKAMVSMALGQTGVGKSQVAIAITAAVTRGTAFPNTTETRPPAKVALITGEDALQQIVIPRLKAAGADMSKVIISQGHFEMRKDAAGKPERVFVPFSLQSAATALARVMTDHPDVGLVVIDPLNAVLGGKVDAYRNNEVRAAMKGVQWVAEHYGVAMLLTHHMKKGEVFTSITDMSGGSNAIVEVCRSIVGVAPEPIEEGAGLEARAKLRYVFEVIKTTIAVPGTAVAYEIMGVTTDQGNKTQKVVFLDEPPRMSLMQALQKTKDEDEGDGPKSRREAIAFLLDHLQGSTEGQSDRELKAAAKEEEISARTLQRARTALEIIPETSGFGKGRRSVWRLPDADVLGTALQKALGFTAKTNDPVAEARLMLRVAKMKSSA